MLTRGFQMMKQENSLASLYKVVTIDSVRFCSCISPTWLHSGWDISLVLLKAGLENGNVAPAAAWLLWLRCSYRDLAYLLQSICVRESLGDRDKWVTSAATSAVAAAKILQSEFFSYKRQELLVCIYSKTSDCLMTE